MTSEAFELNLLVDNLPTGGAALIKQEWGRLSYTQKCNSSVRAKDPRTIGLETKKNLFEALYAHHGGRCFWCSKYVTYGNHNNCALSGTIDHLKTMTMGRRNYYDGGHVLACRKCNGTRNSDDLKGPKRVARKIRIKLNFDEPVVVTPVHQPKQKIAPILDINQFRADMRWLGWSDAKIDEELKDPKYYGYTMRLTVDTGKVTISTYTYGDEQCPAS